MTLRAGFALNIVGSPVKWLIPLRALVAGLRITLHFIKPGTVNSPGPPFFRWLLMTCVNAVKIFETPLRGTKVQSAKCAYNCAFLRGFDTFNVASLQAIFLEDAALAVFFFALAIVNSLFCLVIRTS